MHYPAIDRDQFRKLFAMQVALQFCCISGMLLFYLRAGHQGNVTWQIYSLGLTLLASWLFFRRWDLIVGRIQHLFPSSEIPSKWALGILLYLPFSACLFLGYLAFADKPREDEELPLLFRRPKWCAFLLVVFNLTLPILATQASEQKAEKLSLWGSSPAMFAVTQAGKDFEFAMHLRDELQKNPDLDLVKSCNHKMSSGVGRLLAMTMAAEQQMRLPASKGQTFALQERTRMIENSIALLQGWDKSADLITRLNPSFLLSPSALPEAITITAANRVIEVYLGVLYIAALERQIEFAKKDGATSEKLNQWQKSILATRQAQTIAKNESTWLGSFFPLVRAQISHQ